MRLLGVAFLWLATLNACATAYPGWVTRGSGAFVEADGTRVFVGVGVASGIRNADLAQRTVNNRARVELAKTFEVYAATLMKEYMATTTAGDMLPWQQDGYADYRQAPSFPKHITIAAAWIHSDGTLYALARLELSAFLEEIESMTDLSRLVRQFVQGNAERVHQTLMEEDAQRRER